ncbi:hypothetical protein OIU84_010437 [Salix udensis]|uniref:Uncharacterized protein n=1 Tax=Salix udensis TaxID=889485 RepID=A0AAD6JMT0_9ROSI|nr:hypothetical protein OIU84_010437 [Salix udensis]
MKITALLVLKVQPGGIGSGYSSKRDGCESFRDISNVLALRNSYFSSVEPSLNGPHPANVNQSSTKSTKFMLIIEMDFARWGLWMIIIRFAVHFPFSIR